MRLLGSINDDLLIGGDLVDEIFGGGGDDLLDGRGGSDVLYGEHGDDLLIGSVGTGDDLYDGGAGRDLITYTNVLAGVRIDLTALTARSLVGDTAGIGLDRLAGIEDAEGTAWGDQLVGNGADNALFGREGNDTLVGGYGNDLLAPGWGDDIVNGGSGYDRADYSEIGRGVTVSLGVAGAQNTGAGRDSLVSIENVIGSAFADVLGGSAAHNHLAGGDGNDRLVGEAGNDTLDGGTGADRMTGGVGHDIYHVDQSGDRVIENAGEGTDTIVVSAALSYVLGANVENLIVTAASVASWIGNPAGLISLTGNAGANRLTAGDGANLLDGGAGADRMEGGRGADLYIVDNVRDVVVEFSDPVNGIQVRDTVRSFVSYALRDHVEELELIGSGDLNGTGNTADNMIRGNDGANRLVGLAGADTLIGGRGNDLLDGGAGVDRMEGGDGDDTYIVDDAADHAREYANEGVDTVRSSVSYSLYDGMENLVLTGAANAAGHGTGSYNFMAGNSGENVLYGYGGADTLAGGAGDDFLSGGSGQDRIEGGVGADMLLGGTDADLFVFGAGDLSGAAPGSCDMIQDFYATEGDRMSLSALDADALTAGDQDFFWIGTAAFSGSAGELRFYEYSGNTMVEADQDGDGQADFAIQLNGVHPLTAADFVL